MAFGMLSAYIQCEPCLCCLHLVSLTVSNAQVVLRDFRYKPEDSCNVVTTYFSTQLEVVMAAVQEKFAWLDDEDDPRIIRAALQDDEFVLLLRGYFEAGDTERPKFFKTLATQCSLQGLTLLHLCYFLYCNAVAAISQPGLCRRGRSLIEIVEERIQKGPRLRVVFFFCFWHFRFFCTSSLFSQVLRLRLTRQPASNLQHPGSCIRQGSSGSWLSDQEGGPWGPNEPSLVTKSTRAHLLNPRRKLGPA